MWPYECLVAWNFLCWIGYLFTFSLPLGFRQWTICREVLCYSVIWLNFNLIPKCNLISIWNPMSIVVSIYIPISILVLQNPTIIIHQTLLYSLLLQIFRNFCHKSVSRAFYWHGQVVAMPQCRQYFVLVIFASFLYSDWHKYLVLLMASESFVCERGRTKCLTPWWPGNRGWETTSDFSILSFHRGL